jgi:hypothetical protein
MVVIQERHNNEWDLVEPLLIFLLCRFPQTVLGGHIVSVLHVCLCVGGGSSGLLDCVAF